MKILGEVAPNATFIAVEAGPKPAWKSPDAFYRHSSTKATAVPTLYKWGTAAKLVDVPDCLNEAKIRSLASA